MTALAMGQEPDSDAYEAPSSDWLDQVPALITLQNEFLAPNVRRSVDDPVDDAEAKVLGTISVLEAAQRAGASKVVFASSGGCIYGEPSFEELPINESHPLAPLSPYGASKVAAEQYLWMYAGLYELEWTALTLGNVYGPRQDPAGEAGVISIFLQHLLAGRDVTIFGDGEQTRDYVYVGDVVDAFVRSIDGPSGEQFNVGRGLPTSVNDLYRTIADVLGTDLQPVYAPHRTGELQHSTLDPSRAHRSSHGRRERLRAGLQETAASMGCRHLQRVS